MSSKSDEGAGISPEDNPPATDNTHTAAGAPTDQAHQNAGDGTLTGAVPAGLTSKQLHRTADSGKTDNSGTG